MPTVASIMAALKSKGKEQTRKIYARHGMDATLPAVCSAPVGSHGS
ncbi:MAG TPA: hypothetical protein VGT08_14015 [Terracidiphilus sp.]|nr:hypothetical protein [Terracidiphilus sp.]